MLHVTGKIVPARLPQLGLDGSSFRQPGRFEPLRHTKTDLSKFTVLAFLGALLLAVAGCTGVPERAVVQEPALPDYLARDHRIDEPIDLFIEPRIPILSALVVPQSDTKTYPGVTVVAGPALEKALLSLSQQHFSHATLVKQIEDRPTLTFRLLTFKPEMTVDRGGLTSQVAVSARLALQVTLQSGRGEHLFTATAIGTSHFSDNKLTPGGRLAGHGQLVEVVTRNAIIDAMYDISSIFGSSNDVIESGSMTRSGSTAQMAESFEDVILYLRTLRPDAE